MKTWIRKLIFSSLGRSVLNTAEMIVFGGALRRKLWKRMLGLQLKSQFRRDWIWKRIPPHFTDYDINMFNFAFGATGRGAYNFFNGFFVTELLSQGDRLLDIGCGDGFFARRFYSPICSLIDAVDIEPTAIAAAKSRNMATNIRYQLLDATSCPFPEENYNVIVWDGAIGHFSPDTTASMLEKIASCLDENGVFCGSESLGHEEGHDHLQFFETIDDLRRLLSPYFKYVHVREIVYPMPFNPKLTRREVFWRCAHNSSRLDLASWSTF